MAIFTMMLYWVAPSPMPLVKVWKAAQWNNYFTPVKITHQEVNE
jgi:hypothetical protein